MAEEIVRILKVDTKNSGKSIKELRNEIKGLRSELDKAVVGSEEFESTLKQLTQTQKTYNNLQQQIKDMTRSNQQDMAKMASFARNLGKAYSAANAAIGLFADGNEDVQKAMLKVQRTIQLIQGLDGIAGLVRDLPKVANLFKGWLSFLDPIERKITNIIKGINGANPSKLKAINEAGRGGSSSSSSSININAPGQQQYIPSENKALAEQARTYYPALLQQEKNLYKARENALNQLNATKKSIAEITKFITDTGAAVINAATKSGVSVQQMAEYVARAKTDFGGVLNELMKIPGVNTEVLNQLKMMGYDVYDLAENSQSVISLFADQQKQLPELKKQYEELDAQYKKITADIQVAELGMSKFAKSFPKAAAAARFAAGVIKTALYSIGIGVVIGLLVEGYNIIKKIIEKSRELKIINNEIAQSTNQLAGKPIVVLKELSKAYAKVGDDAKAKEKFLDDYKEKIKETGLAIDTVEEAEDALVKNTPKYEEAIKKRAKAQAIEAAVVKLYTDYLDERYKIEQKLEKAEDNNRQRRQKRLQKQIDELDTKMENRLDKYLGEAQALNDEISGIFASLNNTTKEDKGSGGATDWVEEYKKALEAIKRYNQDRLNEMKDARTRELRENSRAYAEDIKNIQENYEKGVKAAQGNKQKLLEIEKEKNEALKLAWIRYYKDRNEIINKYDEEELERQKRSLDRQYNLLEKQIERNRKLYDTSNLKDPSKVSYQTQYKQKTMTRGLGLLGLGTKEDWVNVYQSKKNIEQQYKDQVEYNNKVYEATKRRVDNEQKLLEQEKITLENKAKLLRDELNKTDDNDLEKRQTLADEIIDIEHSLFTTKLTIAENEMALDDAQRENEQANLEILLETQEKKREALNATLDVVSNLSGAMADMFKMEAQNAAEGSKRQKAATKAYKALAITQAIADTYKGANEAYAAMASIPYVGPALGIAAAATAIAMGIANVKRIISESISGSTQQASVSAPAPVDTAPINYSRNLIGDKELDNINQPIKCYVLESEITSTQNKVKVTEQNATF